jgi:hypothetical protein
MVMAIDQEIDIRMFLKDLYGMMCNPFFDKVKCPVLFLLFAGEGSIPASAGPEESQRNPQIRMDPVVEELAYGIREYFL